MNEPYEFFSFALGMLLLCLLVMEWLRVLVGKKYLELEKAFNAGEDEFNSYIRNKSAYIIKDNFNGEEPDDFKELIAYQALHKRRLLAFGGMYSTGLGREVIIVLFVILGLCSVGLIAAGIFSNFIRYGISGIFGLLFLVVGWRILHIFKTLHSLAQGELDIYRQALDGRYFRQEII